MQTHFEKSTKIRFDVCTPRRSTFDQNRRDVVLQLSDLFEGRYAQDVAAAFFEENFVTNGMKILVNMAFDRLNGSNNQAATFMLSQSMGGGKTHSMIALGLLARFPELRARFWKDKALGSAPIRVIGFDGRESDCPFGIWGALADQLGKKELFADLTTTAISNLMVAANRDDLSNVVIVISDLSGSAYADAGMVKALDDLNQETMRSVLILEPVAAQGEEVYHIFRTRLFINRRMPRFVIRWRWRTRRRSARTWPTRATPTPSCWTRGSVPDRTRRMRPSSST